MLTLGAEQRAECLAGDPGADSNFNDCVNKKPDKISPKLSMSVVPLIAVLNGVANTATIGLYDRFDPTSLDASASPCGNCGNNTREGAEERDGADDALCMGSSCNSDCTCP